MPSYRSTTTRIVVAAFILSTGLFAAKAPRQRTAQAAIRYAHRRFDPGKVAVPAGEPLLIRVVNQSHERIEFESFKLHREQVVDPGETVIVRLPALQPGTYDFFDDFHDAVPEGKIVATLPAPDAARP